jgi:hypothetical protein
MAGFNICVVYPRPSRLVLGFCGWLLYLCCLPKAFKAGVGPLWLALLL